MNKYQEVMEHLSVSQLSQQRMRKSIRAEVRRRRRARLLRLLPLAAAVLLVAALVPVGTLLLGRPVNTSAEAEIGVMAGQAEDGAAPKANASAPGTAAEEAEEDAAPEMAAAPEEAEEDAALAPQVATASEAYAVDADDLEGLEEQTGLSLRELTNLPFEAEEVSYTAYDEELAQIVYTDGDSSLCWRISLGNEDNSGQEEAFSDTWTETISGQRVTLRGEDDTVAVAWWSDGAQAYSIAADPALSREEMRALAEGAMD